jgi:TIR domain-containing protein
MASKKAPAVAPLGPVRVFVSWSKPASKIVAETLRTWLQAILQVLDVFVSSKDIEKGVRWRSEIAGQLAGSHFGIVCLTPENADSRWLNFEGGALARAVYRQEEEPPLYTFLIGMKHTDLKGPMAEYQHTVAADKEDTRKLLHSLRKTAGRVTGRELSEGTIDMLFDQLWPQLEERIVQAVSYVAPTQSRSADDMLAEVLDQVRSLNQRMSRPTSYLPLTMQEFERQLVENSNPDVDQEFSPIRTALSQLDSSKAAEEERRRRMFVTLALRGKKKKSDTNK